MAAQEHSMPFIKNLASSDRKTRTAALGSLQAFLSSRQHAASLSAVEILKLWKGLFYALWMCDRPLPQQALCSELAGLIYNLPGDAVVPWLRGFWATMSREWTSIDVLRMEKFLLLVRRVLGASFQWMKGGRDGRKWDSGRVNAMLALLGEWPFRAETEGVAATGDGAPDQTGEARQSALFPRLVPSGLRIHVLDIWVDEAEKVGMLEGNQGAGDAEEALPGRQILERISALAEALEQRTTSTAVRLRAKDSLADDRLPWNSHEREEGEAADAGAAGDGDSWDGFDD